MKIAIVGSAPSSRTLAPFHDPYWQIWACSPANKDLPKHDVWFEIHSLEADWGDAKDQMEWIAWLKNHPRVYMAKHYPGIKNSIKYPIDEMTVEFGPFFFTSTIALMLAMAIKEKPETIGIYGVDMALTEEYAHQRGACQHFIHEARRRGIEVIVPPESDIAEPPPVYGIGNDSRMWRKTEARRRELVERLHALELKKLAAADEEILLKGALENTNYFLNTWAK